MKHNKDLLNPRIILLCLTILEVRNLQLLWGKLSGQPQPTLWQVPHNSGPFMLFVLVVLPDQCCCHVRHYCLRVGKCGIIMQVVVIMIALYVLVFNAFISRDQHVSPDTKCQDEVWKATRENER
jgi:hypothetical protein